MPYVALVGILVGLFALATILSQRSRLVSARREAYIRSYLFPKGLLERLGRQRPGTAAKDAQLVLRALRQFFLAHLKSGRRFVSMPSQVTDDLWHEFILYTRHYERFCKDAFGRFLHHTPAVVLAQDQRSNAGLRRSWWHCCKEGSIDPRKPSRLPLLFAIDAFGDGGSSSSSDSISGGADGGGSDGGSGCGGGGCGGGGGD